MNMLTVRKKNPKEKQRKQAEQFKRGKPVSRTPP